MIRLVVTTTESRLIDIEVRFSAAMQRISSPGTMIPAASRAIL